MKIKSKILGLSYTGNHYSVILEDMTDKKMKLPIIISDSSAIEISEITGGEGGYSFIEKFLTASQVSVNEIYINEFNSGIFGVKVTLENGNYFNTSVSDSLIIAYSTKCDIYVRGDIMKASGIKLNDDDTVDYSEIEYDTTDGDEELTPIDELHSKLREAIDDERYEEASKIQLDINSRKDT